MKKLSIEEKAKRYDEAIKKAKSKIKNDKDHVLYEDDVIEMFPELKESEDERIRKELIKLMKQMSDTIVENYTTVPISDFVAWLEKQGEQNPAEWHREDEQNLNACIGYIPDEPKFKIGDWLVHNERRNIIKIVNATPLVYEVVNVLGYHYTITDTAIENNYHLWSIADAKDGDVLSYRNGQWIFILKALENNNSIIEYYTLLSEDGLSIKDAASTVLISSITPATKEQRNQLEKAMTYAGYTFDFEKKELKKIEQKPAWSEEDERMYRGLHNLIYSTSYCDSRKEFSDFLNSLKDRVQPHPKQEWSEDDEYHKRQILRILKDNGCSQTLQEKTEKWIEERLKSIRPHSAWKPSEEMIEALGRTIPENVMEISEDEMLLDKLYQGLKYGRVLSEN